MTNANRRPTRHTARVAGAAAARRLHLERMARELGEAGWLILPPEYLAALPECCRLQLQQQGRAARYGALTDRLPGAD